MTITDTRPAPRVRRNRITTVDAGVVGAVSALAAFVAMSAGAHPTGSSLADALVTGAFVAFVTWCGASAPWWILASGAGIAAVAAWSPLWSLSAVAALVLAAFVGASRLSWPPARAACAGIAMNALLHWDPIGFHGLTALVSGAVAVAIAVTGLRRRRYNVRRWVQVMLVGVAAAIVLAVVGAAIAGALAYGDLRSGERGIRDAADALADGDVDTAVAHLESSAIDLDAATRALNRPWALPVLGVPVVGQHMALTVEVAEELASSTDTLVDTAAQINLDSLRVEGGVIDVDAVELLGPPLSATEDVLASTADALATNDSSWLVAPVADRLDTVREEVDGLLDWTRSAITGVDLAPSMLGVDGPRTYLVAFTTPAESRGLGGFMGTWAEVKVDRGLLQVVRSGQTSELVGEMDPSIVLDGPADYVARYGRFGAGGDGAPVAVDFWSNVTMSPDFPSVAAVMSQLYPASGGAPVDGVIAMDVETVARFLELTGPIDVAGPDGAIRLDAANAEDFLLREQYAVIADDDVRDGVLEELTTRMIAEVLGGSLPGPRVLAGVLGPAIADGRLVAWSFDEDDQPLLLELGLAGALSGPGSDGLAVVSNNAGANKLDAYLTRSVTYEVEVDDETGALVSAATIRLANAAPGDLPADAGGNPFGLPAGTNRMYLSVYSPWTLTAAEIDGEPTGMEPSTELGWNVYSRFVEIPPGEEVVLRLGFAGRLDPQQPYELTLWSQPLTAPDVVRVDARTTDGATLHSSHRVRVGLDVLAEGCPDLGCASR